MTYSWLIILFVLTWVLLCGWFPLSVFLGLSPQSSWGKCPLYFNLSSAMWLKVVYSWLLSVLGKISLVSISQNFLYLCQFPTFYLLPQLTGHKLFLLTGDVYKRFSLQAPDCDLWGTVQSFSKVATSRFQPCQLEPFSSSALYWSHVFLPTSEQWDILTLYFHPIMSEIGHLSVVYLLTQVSSKSLMGNVAFGRY